MVHVDGTNIIASVPENSSGFSTLRPELPELPYSIREHVKNIVFIWTLFTLDTAVLPLLLFYALWYHSSQTPINILTITTCVFGLFATIEWGIRTLRLWRREEVRPIGGQRKGVRIPYKSPILFGNSPRRLILTALTHANPKISSLISSTIATA